MVQPKTRWVAAATHQGRYAGVGDPVARVALDQERLEPREDAVEHDRPDRPARRRAPTISRLTSPPSAANFGQGHVDGNPQEHPGHQVEAAAEGEDHAVVDGIGVLPLR